jgi:hypothetical protein
MERVYLEEDIEQIRKYFPGAKVVTLRTPFDLTIRHKDPWRLRTDDFRERQIESQWYGDLLWNQW